MTDGKRVTRNNSSVLPTGTMLKGRYQIDQAIGQGGFGITYSAYDCKANCKVAVKELFPLHNVERGEDRRTVSIRAGQESSFAHMRKSFEKEAQTLIQLQQQEGIVKLMHLFSENDTVYYVMELLNGEDLNHWLKRNGAMGWNYLVPILRTVLDALEEIHSVGLIHRDISPDNIFLTTGGARLIDFGAVRAYQGGGQLTAVIKHSFAPWEQYLSNGNQGPWTDVYALCVTAYYALSGQLPPTAMDRRLNDTLKPLNELCPGLPKEVCFAIHKGMSLDLEKRYQNVGQLRQALFGQEASCVVCLKGGYAGRRWDLAPGNSMRIGRNRNCEVIYPPGYQGVSRTQCTIYRTADGSYLVRDDRSSYGTRLLVNGQFLKMEPGKWYSAEKVRIAFGYQEEYAIK